MTNWIQQSKNSTSFSNQSKNNTSYTLQDESLVHNSYFLLENGDFLLFEDGSGLLLLETDSLIYTQYNYQTKN